jgi:hypothetical protein
VLSAAVVGACLYSCRFTGDPAPVVAAAAHEEPARASSRIGAEEGGSLMAGGATLSLPRGALAADAVVSIESSEPFDTLPLATSLEGLVYDVGPDALMLHVPVELRLPAPAHRPHGKTAVIARWDEVTDGWEDLPTSAGEHSELKAQILSFAVFSVRFVDEVAKDESISCDVAPCEDDASRLESPARASTKTGTTVHGLRDHPTLLVPRKTPMLGELRLPFVSALSRARG